MNKLFEKLKKTSPFLIILLAIPLVIAAGAFIFDQKRYAFITMAVVLLTVAVFFTSFEKRESNGKLIIIIAVMVALSSVGRFVFMALPHFKPVTALVIITAVYFGPQAGFITGALTAVVSNFSFGQGPWTPFQMFSWGIIGLLAGLMSPLLIGKKPVNYIALAVFGALSGVMYSLLMDTWTTLWWDGSFNFSRYIAHVITAGGVTLSYAVSNVLFLLLLIKPIGGVLERIRYKYGLENSPVNS